MLKKLSRTIVLQAANTALPFITIPILVHKLGVDGYGQIGVAIAVIQYLLLFVEFGFSIPSVRSIARSENQKEEASKLFSNTSSVKLLIMLIGMLIGKIIIFSFSISVELSFLLSIGCLIVIGQILTPSWLFIGRESGDILLVMTIIPRILAVPAIVLLVNQVDDIEIAMALQVIPVLVTAFLAIYWAFKNKWLHLIAPTISEMKCQIRIAWPLFIAAATTSLYTSSTPILLNALSGPYYVGVFLIAEKVRQGLLCILPPITMVIYPKMSRVFSMGTKTPFNFIKKLLILMLLGASIFSACSFYFSDNIISILFDSKAIDSAVVLRVMSISIFVTCLITVLGTYILLPLGAEKVYSMIIGVAGFFHLGFTSILIVYFKSIGAAYGMLLTELLIAILMILFMANRNQKLESCSFEKSILQNIIRP
jgi:polysaccharide transporter, PST family